MSIKNIYKNKTVLITGHTGFKGSWLTAWLLHLGAKVIGVSNEVPTNPSLFDSAKLNKYIRDERADITDLNSLIELFNIHKPDFVFHLAAQALVRPSYQDPLLTLYVNAIGTSTILEAIRIFNKNIISIIITSDKVYDNKEWVWGYKETDSFGGKDPYSASKGMAELAIKTYINSYFQNDEGKVKLAVGRAGNVIGGGDWAKDRIVPDCVKSWSNDMIVSLRNPNATRPWQHVLEPLSGYLLLGKKLYENSINFESYNFGPSAEQNSTVLSLIKEMSKHWKNVKWEENRIINKKVYEAGLLKLNCDKALHELNWKPTLDFKETVKLTIEWYKKFYESDKNDMFKYTIKQIEFFTTKSQERHKC